MKVQSIEEFHRGWFLGNFDPAIHKTEDVEVGILHHAENEQWPTHYHTGREINYLIRGSMEIHGETLVTGDVFMLEPYEVADPVFLTDCVVVCVKMPSLPGDKYEVEKSKW